LAPGAGGANLAVAAIRVGFTGHQGLSASTEVSVRSALETLVNRLSPLAGVCSLAEGSDQIFAQAVLDTGGTLVVVVPCHGYEQTFAHGAVLADYRNLLAKASQVVELDFADPSEEAFWAAGKRVVLEAERLVAVWDGKPAGGLGGTADVVEFALGRGMEVDIVWPKGAARRSSDA